MTAASSTVERYPLSWPSGWRRTPSGSRRNSSFHSTKNTPYGHAAGSYKQKVALSVGDAMARLSGELRRLGARDAVVSSNLRTRADGMPYADQAKMLEDPGVAVYFTISGKPRVLACDKWRSAAENLAALAGHIEAVRASDRYGVGTLDQAFAGYKALPSSAEEWRIVLGLGPAATWDDVDERYRLLARRAHPDVDGGDAAQMARLNIARDAARAEFAD